MEEERGLMVIRREIAEKGKRINMEMEGVAEGRVKIGKEKWREVGEYMWEKDWKNVGKYRV